MWLLVIGLLIGSILTIAIYKSEQYMSESGYDSINKSVSFGPIEASFNWYIADDQDGRFGRGWRWCLGIRFSKNTVVIDCLFFYIRISPNSKGV